MSALPPVDAGYAAEIIGALPSRLAKKLADIDPSTWTITPGPPVTVQVGTATVTITGPTEASCDCLLAPRCLHLAGVLSAAPLAEADDAAPTDDAPKADGAPTASDVSTGAGTATGAASSPPTATTAAARTAGTPGAPVKATGLTAAQRACVDLAADTLTTILTDGLTVLTAPTRAAILRVVALARSAALHRLGATFAGLHTAAHSPSRRSVTHLRNAALAVQVLRHGDAAGALDEAALGTARRAYRDIGVQRLRGFVCEPILTDSGYSGVAAHFVAEGTGQLWTVSAVTPGDLSGVLSAYRSSIDLGQLASPIHEAVRSGVLLSPGTGSADGRLGRGKDVRASIRQRSTDPWPPIPGWWTGRATLAGMLDADPHPLLRLEGVSGNTPPPVVGLAPIVWTMDPAAFGILHGAEGSEVEVILRADGDRWLLAAIDAPGWQVDRRPIFPGLDRLRAAELGSVIATRELPESDADFAPVDLSPEAVLARWAQQVALRGRRAVTGADQKLQADRRWLAEHASPHRAAALGRLADVARAGTTTFDGSFVPDPTGLLTAWLGVAL